MEKIFAYCERGTDPAFWAEPLNAISNAAFLIAAIAALMEWNRGRHDLRGNDLGGGVELSLIALVAVIGIGSFLFHTFATRWAAVADVLPITLFMFAYLGYALPRFLGLSWIATIVGLAAFFAAISMAESTTCGGSPCLNGSVGYVPALAALGVIGAWLAYIAHPASRPILTGTALFAVSLAFRTLDRSICPATALFGGREFGTHFIWHVCNAALLYLLLRAAVRHGLAPMSGRAPRMV